MALQKEDNFIWSAIKDYFNAFPDKDSEKDIIKDISAGISFRGVNLWVLIFAVFIASLGLNINSTAVIIGAMLISPLMGPIVGMGLAVGINDIDLLRRSAKNYIVATVISVLTASLYFLITPLNEAQSELLARTAPTLYDVFIALCGGAAGILAICSKGKGNVIPGVAIATALMPPLCTAGYGLASGMPIYFFGAFYLYFINTVFICVATFLGVRMFKFKPRTFELKSQRKKMHRYIWGLVLITMIPASFMTVNIVKDSVKKNNVSKFVRQVLNSRETHIISQSIDEQKKNIELVAVGKSLTTQEIDAAVKLLPQYKLNGYNLIIIQGVQTDSLLLNSKIHDLINVHDDKSVQYVRQNQEIHHLQECLDQYQYYNNLSIDIGKEIKLLFPRIKTISLSKIDETSIDSLKTSPNVVAIVGVHNNSKMFSQEEQSRLLTWLKTRSKCDSLKLVIKR